MGVSNLGINIAVTAAGTALVTQLNAALSSLRGQLGLLSTQQASTANSADSLLNKVVGLTAAFQTAHLLGSAIEEGIKFNSTIEQATLGIAALITAQAQLHDRNGALVTGTEALSAAQGIAADQVAKLRIAGLQTASTTKELVVAFQQGIGAGLKWGLTLDQIRVITVGVTQAASALGVPMNQLNEEVRDLIAGNISIRNTRIASALGITNEDIKNAREAGNLAGFITSKLEAFNVAGEKTARTWQGVTSNVKEALQVLAGDATKPLFEGVKNGLQNALEGIFNLETAQVSDKFSTILSIAQLISSEVGDVLAEGLRLVVDGAQDFNNWLSQNEASVGGIIDATGELGKQFGTLIGLAATLGLDIGDWGTKAGFWKTVLTGAADLLALINSTIQFIGLGLAAIGVGVANFLLQPLIAAAKVASVLAGAIDGEASAALDRLAQQGDAKLDDLNRSLAATRDNLMGTGSAWSQFQADLKKNESQGVNLGINEELRRTTTAIKNEQQIQEKEQAASLQRQTETRKQFEANIRKIRIDSINEQIEAINNAAGKLVGEDEQRKATNAILELQRQKKLLEQGITETSKAAPDDKKTLKEQEQVRHEQLEAQKAQAKQLGKIQEEQAQNAAAAQEGQAKVALARQDISQTDFDKKRIEREQTLNDDVLKIRERTIDQEVALQQKIVDNTSDPSNKVKEQGRLVELQQERLKIVADYDKRQQELELDAQTRAAETARRLGDAGTKDQIDILKSRGQEVDAVRLEMELQYRTRLKELESIGTEEARKQIATIQEVISANVTKAQFDELEKTAGQALARLDDRLTETQQLSDSGQLSARQKQERVVAAYEDTRRTLGQILPQLTTLARDSKNPEAIESVEQLRLKYEQLGITLSQIKDGFAKLKAGLRDAVEHATEELINNAFDKLTGASNDGEAQVNSLKRSLASANDEMTKLLNAPPSAENGARITALRSQIRNMNDELDTAKNSVKSWRDLFVEAIGAVVRELGNLLARMAAVAALNFLTGIFQGAGGGGGTNATLSGDVPNVTPAATGGWISGGVRGRDSVHILGMPDEFILREPATRAIRAKFGEGHLEWLNSLGGGMDIPAPPTRVRPDTMLRMAEGGFVGGGSQGNEQPSSELRGRLLVEHSEDVILRVLESERGLAINLRHVERNRNAFKTVLG